MWDRVDIKGLSITSLIVPYILFSSKLLLETVENTVVLFSSVAEGKMELENINDGSHEVSSKLKPSINLEFIE